MRAAWIVTLVCSACAGTTPPLDRDEIEAAAPSRVIEADATADGLEQVVAHGQSTCVRTRLGKVACFGRNVAPGEPARDSATPVVIAIPKSAEIAAGEDFWCSRDAMGGYVRCWGRNDEGQLGRRTNDAWDHRALAVPGVVGASHLATNESMACAATAEGVSCWGSQTEHPRRYPLVDTRDGITVTSSENRFAFVCGGSPLTCVKVVDPSDSIVDRDVEWTVGGQSRRSTPEALKYAPDISSARIAGCSLFGGGDLSCDMEQLLVRERTRPFVVGSNHVCGIDREHRVWCSGENDAGQVGAEADPTSQLAYPKIGKAGSVAVGSHHSCAITRSGSLYCWGLATSGQLTLPTPEPSAGPQRIALDTAAKRVFAVDDKTCIETAEGVRCSEFAEARSCGTAGFGAPVSGLRQPTRMLPSTAPCLLEDGRLVCLPGEREDEGKSRRVDGEDTVLVDSTWPCTLDDGRVQCRNFSGTHTPFGKRRDVVDIDAGYDMICAVRRSGAVECSSWEPRDEPPRFTAPHVVAKGGFAEVVAAGGSLAATTHERRLHVWPYPSHAGHALALEDVSKVALYADGGCAIAHGGALWCWDEAMEPRRMIEDARIDDVALGHRHGCAVDSSGGLWCWGDNDAGQHGNGETFCTFTPRDVTGAVADAFASPSLR